MDILKNIMPGSTDNEKERLYNKYIAYRDYKLPLIIDGEQSDDAISQLDFNTICPTINDIDFVDCEQDNNTIFNKYKQVRNDYVTAKFTACDSATTPNDCKMNDAEDLNITVGDGPDQKFKINSYKNYQEKDANEDNETYDTYIDTTPRNPALLISHMNKLDNKAIATLYVKNMTKKLKKLEEEMIGPRGDTGSIGLYKHIYTMMDKSGDDTWTNLLTVNKDYVLKDKKKQYEISKINLRLSGHYNEISSFIELYKPLIWYLYWILFVALLGVLFYKGTWSNISSYAFIFTLLFIPTLIMNPVIRLILSKIKGEKLDGIVVGFGIFIILLLLLLFFTNKLAISNMKGNKTPVSPTPTPTPTPTPKMKSPSSIPQK
jgi:hypothetical protein